MTRTPGPRMVAAALAVVLAGCLMPATPFEPRPGAIEAPHVVVAEKPGWPEDAHARWETESGGAIVARTREDVERLWVEPFDGPAPTRYLDTSVIVIVGLLERGTCPLRVLTIDVVPDGNDVGVHMHLPLRLGSEDCGRQFVPRTFAVAVPVAAVGTGPLDVTIVRPDGEDETWTATG